MLKTAYDLFFFFKSTLLYWKLVFHEDSQGTTEIYQINNLVVSKLPLLLKNVQEELSFLGKTWNDLKFCPI